MSSPSSGSPTSAPENQSMLRVACAVQVVEDLHCVSVSKFLLDLQQALQSRAEMGVYFIDSPEFDVNLACALDLTSFDVVIFMSKNAWCEDVTGVAKTILEADCACVQVLSDSSSDRQAVEKEQSTAPFYIVTRTHATLKPFYDTMKTVRMISSSVTPQRLAPLLRETLLTAASGSTPLRRVSRRTLITTN
jgi:hypothetical protein